MNTAQSQSQRIWIIGASSGIGRDLALRFAIEQANSHIVVSARSTGSLLSLKADIEYAGAQCSVVPLDVTDAHSLDAARKKLARLFPEEGTLGLTKVVYNAGTCEYMDTNDIDVLMAKRVFDTNYFGALEVSHIALPLLRKERDMGGSASLIFVSSSVTYQALPRAHAYGASKSALRYFAECMFTDLQKEKIAVQLVSPGFVDTPMTKNNDFDMPFIVSSEEAAKRIYKGIVLDEFDIAFPKSFTILLKTIAHLPTRLRFKLLGSMSRHQPPMPRNEHETIGKKQS